MRVSAKKIHGFFEISHRFMSVSEKFQDVTRTAFKKDRKHVLLFSTKKSMLIQRTFAQKQSPGQIPVNLFEGHRGQKQKS